MNCPLTTHDHADLLEYSAGAVTGGAIEAHVESCGECRRFVQEQRAVWAALEAWDAPAVSPDFDQKLFRRIANDRSWWDRLTRPLRPLVVHRGLAAAAVACLLITAGLMLERTSGPAAPAKPDAAIVEIQPEQLEKALDAMDVLSEFSRKTRPEGTASKL
jgi:hypothetical protein